MGKVLIEGEWLLIMEFFDEDGDEVDSWEEAASFIAGPDKEGYWHTQRTEDYGTYELH